MFFQLVRVKRNTINTGKINSAEDNPNQPMLNALPLDFVKYLEIVVVAVWDIIPWPENLINNIAINKNDIDEILEKKKQEKASNKITNKANFEISMSSIFWFNKCFDKHIANWIKKIKNCIE